MSAKGAACSWTFAFFYKKITWSWYKNSYTHLMNGITRKKILLFASLRLSNNSSLTFFQMSEWAKLIKSLDNDSICSFILILIPTHPTSNYVQLLLLLRVDPYNFQFSTTMSWILLVVSSLNSPSDCPSLTSFLSLFLLLRSSSTLPYTFIVIFT